MFLHAHTRHLACVSIKTSSLFDYARNCPRL